MQSTLRRVVACAAAFGMTLIVSSCSSTAEDTPSPTPSATTTPTMTNPTDLPVAPTPSTTPIPASTDLNGITATGGFGDSPELKIPTPWAIDSTKTKVLVQGTGLTVPETGIVQVNYYGENARTGDVFDESYSKGVPASLAIGTGTIAGFQKGLAGQKVGTRLILAIPGVDGYDANGGQSDAGIEIGDTLVFVVDIVNTEIPEPTGQTVAVTDSSLPTVGGELMAPTVTVPSADPPTKLVVQQLIKGVGPKVVAEDSVKVNYAEYMWANGKMIRQTYGFSPLIGQLSGTIKGWQEALVGQTVGSRLLLVVPPDLAYPDGYPKYSIPEGATMVYVIDIQYAFQS